MLLLKSQEFTTTGINLHQMRGISPEEVCYIQECSTIGAVQIVVRENISWAIDSKLAVWGWRPNQEIKTALH